jgi:hypothetical protein
VVEIGALREVGETRAGYHARPRLTNAPFYLP